MINPHDTAARLRVLARKLETGENIPDFLFCMVDGEDFVSAHKANKNIFGLIGLVEYRLNLVVDEIED